MGAPRWSSGTSGVAGFTQVRPWGRRVHPRSQDSLGSALGVVVFIPVRWVYWGAFCGLSVRLVHPGSLGSLGCTRSVVGFIRGRWVHRGSPWGSSGSSGATGFTGVRPGDLWGHPGSLDSLGYALGSSGSSGFTGVHPGDRRVHPGSLGTLGDVFGVVGYFCGL